MQYVQMKIKKCVHIQLTIIVRNVYQHQGNQCFLCDELGVLRGKEKKEEDIVTHCTSDNEEQVVEDILDELLG